jgi:predicted TIM-barrel fold metal-dependent hydrolase
MMSMPRTDVSGAPSAMFRDLAVAGADVEDRAAGVHERAQRLAQNRNAAVEHDAVVQLTKGCSNHVRASRSLLVALKCRATASPGDVGGFRRY